MMGVSMTSAPMAMQAGGANAMMFRPMAAPMPGMTAPFTAAQPMNVMSLSYVTAFSGEVTVIFFLFVCSP